MAFGYPFLPTTDSESSGDVFLASPPSELLDAGKFSKVPMMAGFTSHEGILARNCKF
jgi:hypothetical protein